MARALLILLMIAAVTAAGVTAQDTPPAAESACEAVEALMILAAQTNSKPDQIIQGGGTIRDGTPVQAQITAADAGDRWVFGAANSVVSGLTQITLDTNVPLRVRVFRGLNPVELLVDNVRVPQADIAPGLQTVSALLAGDGYYTIVVQRQSLADVTQTGSYTLTLGANVAGGLPAAPVDWRGAQALAAQRELLPENGLVTFSPEPSQTVTLRVPADALRSIQVERSIILELASLQGSARGTLSWVREYVRELALLDGSLSVYLNNGGFVYIGDYRASGRDSFTDEFNTFTLQNDGRSVRGINWNTVQNLWLLPGCMGLELRDGARRFIAEGSGLVVTERSGAGGLAQTLAVTGGSAAYNLALEWQDLERVQAAAGLVDVNLTAGRSLRLDRRDIAITHPPDSLFTVTEGSTPLLATDWANVERFEVVGDRLRVTVQDLRGIVDRRGRVLRALEARSQTLLARWQDGSQTLMLPASVDFIEIDTPAALPAYEAGLSPLEVNPTSGAVGLWPANFDNGGHECFPINTILTDLNCVPDGAVNPANGGLTLTLTDLYARGARLDLLLSRTYNSHHALVDGPFGRGWSTEYLLDYAVDYAAAQQARPVAPGIAYPVSLDVTYAPLGRMIYTTASGSRHLFERGASGWTSQTMPGWFIAPRADALVDGWHLVQDTGVIHDFDRAGRLIRIRHIHGGALTVEREAFSLTEPDAPTVYRIQDGTGRSLRLLFNGDRHIVRSELYDGETLIDWAEYEYDAGFLAAVRYSGGAVARYAYTETGLLRQHDDPRAPLAQSLAYGYDEQGRVIWIDPQPNVTPEQCSAGPRPFRCYRYTSASSQVSATQTDAWGREQTWVYSLTNDFNSAYRLLSHTGPDGTATTYAYGSGATTRFPANFSRAGLQHTLRWEAFGQPTLLQADTWINFSAVYNTSVRIDINNDGTPDYTLPLLQSYQADGERGPTQPARYTYDPATGQPVAYTDSAGLITQITGREARFGLPTLASVTAGDTVSTLTLDYDRYGFVASRQDETGIDRYTWDAFGRPVRYERADPAGTALVAYTISYNPTADGRCMIVTDPLNTQTAHCFDLRDRLVAQTTTNAQGDVLEQFRYEYDAFDRLVARTQQTGSGTPISTRYTYTAEGVGAPGQRRVIETLPNGLQQVFTYDAAERLVAMQDSLGQITTYSYPPPAAAAETVIQRDPNGVETTYEYNRARQLVRLDYGPVEWGLLYGGSRASAQREPSQMVLNSGQGASATVDFDSYDSAGRLTQVSFKIRRPADDNLNAEPVRNDNTRADMTLRYSYDAKGRLLAVENPVTAEFTRLRYDQLESGTRTVTVDNGQPITYTYDALDRLLRVASASGQVNYAYRYNVERGLLEVDVTFTGGDAPPQSWLLAYDSLGNLREWRNEEGRLARYRYDQRSRLIEVVYVAADGSETLAAEYAYNTADQVTSWINEAGLEARFVYNERGQLTTRRDFDGVVLTYLYDTRGNVQAVSDGLGYTTLYTYDDRSRLRSITDPLGRQITYDWLLDNIGELRVTSDDQGSTRYIFDLFDRLWQIRDAQDNRHLLRYDFGGRLSEWRQANGALTLGLAYGPGGQLNAINGPENWRWRYVYNELGQLIERVDPDGHSLQLGFDRLGRLLALTAPGGDYERRFERPEPGRLQVTLGDTQTLYQYDVLGRRTLEAQDDAVYAYTYQDDGYTLAGPDGALTTYTYSGVLGDPEVPFLLVETYTPAGELTSSHSYQYSARGQLTGILRESRFANADTAYQRAERIDYDAAGRPIRYIDSENNLYAYAYDQAGRLVTTQYPDGSSYTYEYDLLNRLTGLINPTGQRLSFSYNALNHLTGFALNDTALESYRYSPLGWLLARTYADYRDGTGEIQFRYSAAGVPQGWSVGGRAVTFERSPDALGRLLAINDGAGENTEYTYSAAGRLTGAGDAAYSYDGFGRLAGANLGRGGILTYTTTADDSGQSLTITLPDGQMLRFALDSFGHLRQVTANDQSLGVTYDARQLDANILEAQVSWGGRYTTLVRFNRLGHILLLQTNADQRRLRRFAYTSNYAGTPLTIDDRENDILLGYDNVHRPLTSNWLVTAGLKPQDSVDYAFTLGYDAQGNRIRELRQTTDGQVSEIFYSYQGTLLRSRSAGAQTAVPSGAAAALSGVALSGALLLALGRRRRYLLPALAAVWLGGGLLIAQAQPAPALEYRYNDAGHVASITDLTAGGAVTAFTYDGYGRLTGIARGEETVTLSYDPFGRLSARETAAGRADYRYSGGRLVGISDNGRERLAVSLLDDQYLLLTGAEGSRWTLYDALGAVRQSFLEAHTDPGSVVNRFDILGRALDGAPAEGTPLLLPLFRGMLYEPQFDLYIGLDGRAYDPTTGRYLQRSLTGPDAAGSLYGFTLQAATPPVQRDGGLAFTEPLRLLRDQRRLLDTPTAASVRAAYLPDLYAGWQDTGLQALAAFQADQMGAFTRLTAHTYQLIQDYNRLGMWPDARGYFRLYDTTNPARPAGLPPLPPLSAPHPDQLPALSLRWLPQPVQIEAAAPRWYDSAAWRSVDTWAAQVALPQPVMGERAPGLAADLLPLPLRDITALADWFDALADLPVAPAADWIEQIDAAVLPAKPFSAPASAADWLARWFSSDTLPVWSQLRALYQLPAAPEPELPALSLTP